MHSVTENGAAPLPENGRMVIPGVIAQTRDNISAPGSPSADRSAPVNMAMDFRVRQ
jgi:hypothetical protein